MSKGTPMRTIRVAEETWSAAKQVAARQGVTMTELIRDFLMALADPRYVPPIHEDVTGPAINNEKALEAIVARLATRPRVRPSKSGRHRPASPVLDKATCPHEHIQRLSWGIACRDCGRVQRNDKEEKP